MNSFKMNANTDNSRMLLTQNFKQQPNLFMALKEPQNNPIIGSSFKPATQPSLIRPPPGPPSNKTGFFWGGNGSNNNRGGRYFSGGGNNNNNNDDSEEGEGNEDNNHQKSSIVTLFGI